MATANTPPTDSKGDSVDTETTIDIVIDWFLAKVQPMVSEQPRNSKTYVQAVNDSCLVQNEPYMTTELRFELLACAQSLVVYIGNSEREAFFEALSRFDDDLKFLEQTHKEPARIYQRRKALLDGFSADIAGIFSAMMLSIREQDEDAQVEIIAPEAVITIEQVISRSHEYATEQTLQIAEDLFISTLDDIDRWIDGWTATFIDSSRGNNQTYDRLIRLLMVPAILDEKLETAVVDVLSYVNKQDMFSHDEIRMQVETIRDQLNELEQPFWLGEVSNGIDHLTLEDVEV